MQLASSNLTQSNETLQVMSVQELQAKYIRMCMSYDLDYTEPPASQLDNVVDDNVHQCLQRLIKQTESALEQKVFFARGRVSAIRSIYASLSDGGINDFRDAFNLRKMALTH